MSHPDGSWGRVWLPPHLVVLVDDEDLGVLGEGLGQELPELAEPDDADLEPLLRRRLQGRGRGRGLSLLALLGQQVQGVTDGTQQLAAVSSQDGRDGRERPREEAV